MRYAVVGSRQYPNLGLVRDWVLTHLERGDVLVSGGATGADKEGQAAAEWAGHPVVVHRPDPALVKSHGWPYALLARNTTIAEDCDEMVAFWDGKSRGTQDAIRKARRLGKPVTVYGPDGLQGAAP